MGRQRCYKHTHHILRQRLLKRPVARRRRAQVARVPPHAQAVQHARLHGSQAGGGVGADTGVVHHKDQAEVRAAGRPFRGEER
jgi:hypothetical protein